MALGNGTRIALAGLAALGLFGAIVWTVPVRTGEGEPSGRPAAPSAEPAAEPTAEAARDVATAESALAFDTVRIEADGSGVVAGRAEPGATVTVLAAGEVAAEAEADGQGNFVAFLDLPPSEAPRELTLREGADGPVAAASVLLGPTAPAAEGAAAGAERADGGPEAPAPAEVAEALPAVAAGAGAPATAEAPAQEPAGSEMAAGVDPAAPGDAVPRAGPSPPVQTGRGPELSGPTDAADEPASAEAQAAPAQERGPEPVRPESAAAEGEVAPGGADASPDAGGEADPNLAATDEGETSAEAQAVVAMGDPAAARPPEGDALPGEAEAAPDGSTPTATETVAEPEPRSEATDPVGSAEVAEAAATGADAALPQAVVAAPSGPVEGTQAATVPSSPSEASAEELAASPPVLADGGPASPAAPGADPGAVAPSALAAVASPGGPGAPEAPAAAAEPAVSDAAPAVATEAPGLAAPEPEAVAPPVLVSDAEGVRVLQPALAPGADAEVLRTVALDAIAYDAAGGVRLSGRATGGGEVRAYLDNAPVETAAVGPDGQWALALAGAAPGVYTLRIDQVGPDGQVVSRIETPFKREERDALAAAMSEAQEAGQTIAVRTVQPGNTLWAISRDRYGDGTMYVQVFALNRDRIRDPDLIYPGQVFVLPATDGR